jgi:hypothetical protein
MWILVVLFGLRLLTDVLIVPLITPGFQITIADAWWRLLAVGLVFLTFMILWNAYKATQRWSWTALLITVVLFFGGSVAIHVWRGDTLWLVGNGIGLVVALIALAMPFREFFGT